MILFINTCVRPASRTLWLARRVLERVKGDREILEIKLDNKPLDYSMLEYRTKLSEREDFSDPLFNDAKIFSEAEEILIAAPFWDLSFPAILKNYIEAINIVGLTFKYLPDGQPLGLCKAKRLIYVTTAGGKIFNEAYGYGYIKDLAENFYGIPIVKLIKAEGLDIIGANVTEILNDAEKNIAL